LVEKKKGKYALLDFTKRGDDEDLGLPAEDGQSATPIDILHRLLWLLDHRPPSIPEFLTDAQPNLEQLRLVAQALVGPALTGGEMANISVGAEQATLGKLLANWNAVMEGKAAADRQQGQTRLKI
jgi:putative DNA methylase